jgi:hypothetical protein
MSHQVIQVIQLMTRHGITDTERVSLSTVEREVMAEMAFENGYSILFEPLLQRWLFVRTKHPREVQAMRSMWLRGPRKVRHPRSRRRWR